MDFIVVVAGILSALAYSSIKSIFESFFYRKNERPETLEDRIEKLSSALKDSSRLVSEVEGEIEKRKSLVVELQQDADRYQKLVSLNEEQVNAVTQLLTGELQKESRSSFWKGVVVNAIFFVLGAGLSWHLSSGA